MTDITTVVERYFSFWNEADEGRRRELLASTFADDATYAGPLLDGVGHDGIAAIATQLREHLAGFHFNRTGSIDAHHNVVRYGWEIVPAPGAPLLAAGIDFCQINADGRLQSVSAFLDVAPALID